MDHDHFPDPGTKAAGWRLAGRLGAPGSATRTHVDGHDLVVFAEGEESAWVVAEPCPGCGGSLADARLEPADATPPVLRCAHCGAGHELERDDGPAVPVMVVEQEIYVHLEDAPSE